MVSTASTMVAAMAPTMTEAMAAIPVEEERGCVIRLLKGIPGRRAQKPVRSNEGRSYEKVT
ncbi:hypothetical protein Acsp03_47050 [Actinomadura sp. NBRC 104412]|nr:hypothetical protein Acsp03_47050 [Actinomadura sp. NBRC 104412]